MQVFLYKMLNSNVLTHINHKGRLQISILKSMFRLR